MSSLEELFAQAANRAGGIENLLDEFFGFLHRRTDFYVEIDKDDIPAAASSPQFRMGFLKGRAEQIVNRSFKKYPFKPYSQMVAEMSADQVISKSPASARTITSTKKASAASMATSDNPPSRQSANVPTPSTPPPSSSAASSFETPTPSTELKVRYTDKGKQVPIGNGGIGENYFWTQTFKDVTITINVPDSIRTKDVLCSITAKELVVRVAGNEVLAGTFEDPVNVSESLWTMAQDPALPYKQLVIALDKTRETWWKSAFVGHVEIDTSMVDSTKRFGEFDSSTQATLSKLLWEQREKKHQPYDPPNQLYDALNPPDPFTSER